MELKTLQINDPLVERLYSALVGEPANEAAGAAKRLANLLNLYVGYGDREPLLNTIRMSVPMIKMIPGGDCSAQSAMRGQYRPSKSQDQQIHSAHRGSVNTNRSSPETLPESDPTV